MFDYRVRVPGTIYLALWLLSLGHLAGNAVRMRNAPDTGNAVHLVAAVLLVGTASVLFFTNREHDERPETGVPLRSPEKAYALVTRVYADGLPHTLRIRATGEAGVEGSVTVRGKTEAQDAVIDLMVRRLMGRSGSVLVIEEVG